MKNNIFKNLVLLISALSFVSCASSSKSTSAQVRLRPVEEKTLANGLKILFIQDNSLPRMGMTLLVGVGSLHDQKGKEGLNSLTAGMIEQGTKTRTATQIADEFGQLGSDLSPSSGLDFTTISTDGLSQYKSELLALYADTILNPVFAAGEIDRKKSQNIAALTKLVDNPTAYADAMLDKETFGQHPYSHPVIGEIPALRKMNQSDLKDQYARFYVPGNSTLAVYGQLDEAFKGEVEKVFSQWKSATVPKVSWSAAKSTDSSKIKIYSKTGLTQTQIRFGQIGFERTASDFLPARIGNVVLGGAFASRLNQRVRDDLGLTYSISSSFEARKEKGPLEVSTFTRNDKVGDTIKSTKEVLEKFEKEGITNEELNASKALLVGQFPATIETVDRYAFNLLILKYYGIPETYLSHFIENVNKVTLDQVNTAIRKYYKAGNYKVIVYADEKLVGDQVKALGPTEIETLK